MPLTWGRRIAIPRRRLVAAGAAAGVLLGISFAQSVTTARVEIAPKLAASGPWLDRLNVWRGSTGVSPLTENATWSAGDYNHAVYMVKNNLVTHYETPGTPYYTPEGDAAAQASNIYVSSSTSTADTDAIDWWMQAPFHALGLMDPRLTTTGFGSYREVKSGWQMGAAVDTLRGNPFTGGQYPVFFPGNGTTEPLTSYGGYESPDPLQACPGYTAPTGLPVFIQVGGNVSTSVGAHAFTANGAPLTHCVVDTSNAAVGASLRYRGAVLLIPRSPLVTGTTYTVALTVNGVPYTWSFTVGQFQACNTLPTGPTANLTSDKASPQATGTTITFTATSTGCSNPEYRYYVQDPFGAWSMARDYGAPTFVWNTAGLVGGTYHVDVWVRQKGGGAPYEAFQNVPYMLVDPLACTSAGETADKASPQQVGTVVLFTATSAGCGQPTYRFYLKRPDGFWYLMQDYGGATFGWNSASETPGTYTVNVWVRRSGSSAGYEAFASTPYTLVAPLSCKSAAETANNSSPQQAGTVVTFTGTSPGCGQPTYRFYLKRPNGIWYLMQDYGGPTFVWNSAAETAGAYTVNVWVRRSGSSAAYEAFATLPYVLTAPVVCSGAHMTFDKASPQARGTAITVTATSSGCSQPQYIFYVQAPNGVWSVARDYGGPTFVWTTSGLPAGTYHVDVWARQNGSAAAYESFENVPYSLS